MKKNNKKTVFIILGIILIALIIFLIWFFNRKFDVTFDLNNGSENIVVKVKYNHVIDEKDIKSKEDLGEKFIDWYEVIDVKNNEDVLDEKPFDFKTKIKENRKLKAVYEGEVQKITITFDSKGGSKVNSITIEKGSELSFPNDPTYKGYTFIGWTDKNGKVVADKTVFNEDTTLYAKWQKLDAQKVTITFDSKGGSKVNSVVINKGSKLTFPSNPTYSGHTFAGWTDSNGNMVANNTTFNANATLYAKWNVIEEKISLSVNNKVIHKNGINTAKAVATVENKQGDVTYSISSSNANYKKCVGIDAKTGVITAFDASASDCHTDMEIIVTATSKTGKVATAKITKENDLSIMFNNVYYVESTRISDITALQFTLIANMNVTWSTACSTTATSACRYVGKTAEGPASFYGKFGVIDPNSGNFEDKKSAVRITATSPAKQKITLTLSPKIN